MYTRLALFAAFVMVLGAVGCNQAPVQAAVTGSLPNVPIPVGPIPGAGQKTNLPTNPYENNQVALVQGRKLFHDFNCDGCHGGHGGGGMAPSLRDPVWRYGGADAEIFSSISEGRSNGMPAWGTRLPQNQIWELVAYIKSMRTNMEPEPPIVSPRPPAVTPGQLGR